jgi:hypothetical protein
VRGLAHALTWIFGKDILIMFSKRKQKRESVVKECRVVCPLGNWSSDGAVVNISEGGAGVELEKLPTTKDEVILYMTDIAGKEIIKNARVAWFINKTPPDPGATVGLNFV